MAVTETTPLVQAMDSDASNPPPWGAVALLCIFYATGGVYTIFSVFIRNQVSETLGTNADFVSECQSLFWLGYVASTMMLLPAFDTYGRSKPFFLAGWIGLFAAGVSFLTTETWVYALCQFMIGFSLMPVGNMSYVWASELVPASSHNNVCSVYNVCYSAVGIGIAAASYAMKDSGIAWQVQQALWYLPVALGLLVGPFLVPESLEPTMASQKRARSGEGLDSVFRQPVLSQTVATMVCWFAVATAYYGLSYASDNLAPDVYLQMGLLSMVDILCYVAAKFIVDLMGTKTAQMTSLAGASAALLLCAVLPEKSVPLMCASLFGRLCISVAFATIFLLIYDFPASLRASALGAANVTARLGCAISPLLATVPPSLVCGGLSLAALCASAATWSLPA